MKKRLLLIVAVLVLAGFVWLAVGRGSKEPTASAESPRASVEIEEKGTFNPATITVKKGTTITWTNTDYRPHSIGADPYPTSSSLPEFNSNGEIPHNAAYSFTFTQTGTFGYHDNLNIKTLGTVIVTD